MKYFPLIWAMLWRSRTRTWLTFLSIAVAFLLFGVLQAVNSAFHSAVRLANDDLLIVTHRFGIQQPLPYAHRAVLEAMDGVASVTPMVFFGGTYQDSKNQIPSFAADPRTVFDTNPTLLIAPDQLQAFQQIRQGAVAGRELAAKYGWKIGDRITLVSGWTKTDDSTAWEFELVGIFTLNERLTAEGVSAMNFFFSYDYMEESRKYKGLLNFYGVRVSDPAQLAAVGRAIDQRFRNSSAETRSQTQGDFAQGFARQIGDVGLLLKSILAAVFFTLLLVAGNTMMQAFRERIPELAVLKTLGYRDGTVAGLVVGESLLLCVGGAGFGLLLAGGLIVPLRALIAQFFPVLNLGAGNVLLGLLLAAAAGLLAAAIPAWRARRLSVVDGLASA